MREHAFLRKQAHLGPVKKKAAGRDTVVCIGGGPSLLPEDVRLVEESGHDMCGINNAYQLTDKLRYHYGCDTKWWLAHWDKIDQPWTEKYSLKVDDKDDGMPGVTQMQRGSRNGLSRRWPILNTGGNSGYQAMNLMYFFGYQNIILLGYDMMEITVRSHTGKRVKKRHWHPDHTFACSTNPSGGTFHGWIVAFQTLADDLKGHGVRVINATRNTALTCFTQKDLEEAL